MPIKPYTLGSGITRRPRIQITGPWGDEENKALIASLRAAAETSTFESSVAATERWAVATLEAAGKPVDRGPPGMDADAYRAPEWYAAEILFQLDQVRRAVVQGDAAQAAHRALHLGKTITEAALKRKVDEPRAKGLDGGNWTRKQKAERFWKPWVEHFGELRRAGMSAAAARQRIGGMLASQGKDCSDKTLQKRLK